MAQNGLYGGLKIHPIMEFSAPQSFLERLVICMSWPLLAAYGKAPYANVVADQSSPVASAAVRNIENIDPQRANAGRTLSTPKAEIGISITPHPRRLSPLRPPAAPSAELSRNSAAECHLSMASSASNMAKMVSVQSLDSWQLHAALSVTGSRPGSSWLGRGGSSEPRPSSAMRVKARERRGSGETLEGARAAAI